MTTDNADRMPYGCDTFDSCPVGDRDIMNDEWDGDRPKCGGYGTCEGCRRCCPPDHESKPYGWGIERFEDPVLARANAEAIAERDRLTPKYTSAWVETWGMRAGYWPHHSLPTFDREFRDLLWKHYSRQSLRRLRHSDIVWNRLCDECGTHPEAVKRYSRWAAHAVTVRYRDEEQTCTPSQHTLRPASSTSSTPSRSRRPERLPTAS